MSSVQGFPASPAGWPIIIDDATISTMVMGGAENAIYHDKDLCTTLRLAQSTLCAEIPSTMTRSELVLCAGDCFRRGFHGVHWYWIFWKESSVNCSWYTVTGGHCKSLLQERSCSNNSWPVKSLKVIFRSVCRKKNSVFSTGTYLYWLFYLIYSFHVGSLLFLFSDISKSYLQVL